jgi:phage terminase large subunit-like protein
MSPSSPIYSPARTQRRLSSTDSGKTSSSTGSVKSLGAFNPFGGSDICINQSALNLQESLNEFAQLQQKVRLEQEGLSLPAHRFQISSSEIANTERSSSSNIQSSFSSHSQVTNVLCSLNPYPPQMLAASEGGGKVPSSLSLKSKLHATIKSEPTLELSNCPSRKSSIYTTKPTPLLRQVLEEKSFEQKYGVKPLDFVMETNTIGSIEKSSGEPQSEPESFVKQDVAGISNNPVISLAMDQVKKDILTTCEILSISPDPSRWSKVDIKNWMTWTQQQYNIPPFDFGLWASYTGTGFVQLTEEDFKQRIPQGGDRMFAQLDLWRSAALASSTLSALSSDINALSENKKKQREQQLHVGINTSSPTVAPHEVTMSRNNPAVQTPPPLASLQSPQPFVASSILYNKPQGLDFESTHTIMGHNIGPNKDNVSSLQLPDISTLSAPTLKHEKFDIYDVLNMLDPGHGNVMESHEKPVEIKREHHCSGPPQYPVFSQTPSSTPASYNSLSILPASSHSTSLGTQQYFSSFQPQALRPQSQLIYSSGLTTNTTGGNLLITQSPLPSLQIINTTTTISSPRQMESKQQMKHQHSIMSSQQLSQGLPPPYPGTTVTSALVDQSINQQPIQQSQTPFMGHNETKFSKHADDDEDLDVDDMDESASVSHERKPTPAVTISPVNVPAAPTTNISGRTTTNIHLWQFIKELLLNPELHSSSIHWVDRETGIFKIVDSVRVATLWGKRKNRPAMNYDKLSRSLRQYYKKGIMKKNRTNTTTCVSILPSLPSLVKLIKSNHNSRYLLKSHIIKIT